MLLAAGTGERGPLRHRKASAELISLLASSSLDKAVFQKLKCFRNSIKASNYRYTLRPHKRHIRKFSSDYTDLPVLKGSE